MLNDYALTEYCNDIAEEIARDADSLEQAIDWAHESADGSEHVIYYAKAHQLCQNCDTMQGEDFVAQCFDQTPMTYDDMACRIAYGEIDARISARLWEIFEGKEAA